MFWTTLRLCFYLGDAIRLLDLDKFPSSLLYHVSSGSASLVLWFYTPLGFHSVPPCYGIFNFASFFAAPQWDLQFCFIVFRPAMGSSISNECGSLPASYLDGSH